MSFKIGCAGIPHSTPKPGGTVNGIKRIKELNLDALEIEFVRSIYLNEAKAKEVNKIAGKLNAIIVLKGKVDVISDSIKTKLNYSGNPGMTVGGTGDLLSGIIGGLIAKKNDPFEAAVAGVFVNGAAGDFAVHKLGYHILATDLLKWIPYVFNNPQEHNKVKKPRG